MGAPAGAHGEETAIQTDSLAGVNFGPEVPVSLSPAQTAALRGWSEAWNHILREHESATGEGIRIFLEVHPSSKEPRNKDDQPARIRWLEWTGTGNSTQTQRCVGVAQWTSPEKVGDSLPEWSLFCGLAIDAALGDSARLSPFSSLAVRLRRRLAENLRVRNESDSIARLDSLPASLLESQDLVATHILLLLSQLQSPLSLGPQALLDRWTESSADGDRIHLWEDLSLAIRNAGKTAEFIGGDEELPQEIPFSRWALAAAVLSGLPLLIPLAAWLHSREVRWTRFGRRKVSAVRWVKNGFESLRIRWSDRGQRSSAVPLPSTGDDMEVLHGNW